MLRPLAIVASVVVLGVVAGAEIIHAWRDRSYRHWPRLLRWPFLTAIGALGALGAVGPVGHYIKTWGAPAATWFVIAPLVYGLWRGWSTGQGSV